jgi:hypothetical protein
MPQPYAEQITFCGQSLIIRSSEAGLHAGLLEILRPQPKDVPPVQKRPITLDFHLAPQSELDRILPIAPSAVPAQGTGLLLDGRLYAESTHHGQDGSWWREYEGLGRQFWDLRRDHYSAVFIPEAFWEHFPLRYLYLVIALSLFLRSRQVMPVHAGCVVVDGKGILLSAASGGGKSTTSLMLAQMDHPLLSDERIFLWTPEAGRYQASSLSDVVKLDQKALDGFVRSLKAQKALCRHGGDLYFKLSRCGLAFSAQAPVSALCSLEICGQSETTWEPMPPVQAVPGLFPVTMPIGFSGQTKAVFAFLMDMLKTIPCFKVRVGSDAESVASSVRDLASRL